MAGNGLPVWLLCPHQIVVRIKSIVLRIPIAYLKVPGDLVGAVYEMMTILAAGRKACTHAGRQQLRTGFGDECQRTFQNIYEFVLVGVPMPQRRLAAGGKLGEVDADLGESERIA